LIEQLLRERPPGYGGVERVAHHLASFWGGRVFSLATKGRHASDKDPLTVTYPRVSLNSVQISRLYLPLPSRYLIELITASFHLHGHLPSPEVLILLLLARIINPKRIITLHWHSFLDERPGLSSWAQVSYQKIAFLLVPFIANRLVTTSPTLREELKHSFPSVPVDLLPCSLDHEHENHLLRIQDRCCPKSCLRVIFIGRLDSYKRVDWLIGSLQRLSTPWRLSVVGDGPKRFELESLVQSSLDLVRRVSIHGRVDENEKYKLLSESHVLVLPSDRCNEAFGIVQLEAMASGIPSLAYACPRSGMAWVCDISSLSWSHEPAELPSVLAKLTECNAFGQACSQARDRYTRFFSVRAWQNALVKITMNMTS